MLHFFTKLLIALVTLLLASILIFIIVEIVPGDPAALMMGLNANPEALAALRAEFGFDQPVLSRYFRWVGGMLTGDFGISYTYRIPVAALISERMMVSLPLALLSLFIAMAIGLPLGIWAGYRPYSTSDQSITGLSQLGLALPNFWIGVLLVGVVSVQWGWLSAGGFPGWQTGPGALSALLMPALALAIPQAAILTRIMRASLIETASKDYVRTARAKGLSVWQTLIHHRVRNGMIPVLTILGLQFSFLIAGGVIIEKVFFLPGLGQLLLQAVAQRDLITVRAIVLLLVVAVLGISLLVDAIYQFVDPRLRTQSTAEVPV